MALVRLRVLASRLLLLGLTILVVNASVVPYPSQGALHRVLGYPSGGPARGLLSTAVFTCLALLPYGLLADLAWSGWFSSWVRPLLLGVVAGGLLAWFDYQGMYAPYATSHARFVSPHDMAVMGGLVGVVGGLGGMVGATVGCWFDATRRPGG